MTLSRDNRNIVTLTQQTTAERHNTDTMNTLILIQARDRKRASEAFDNANIDNVIVAGGVEVEDDNIEKACEVLKDLCIVHFVATFEV